MRIIRSDTYSLRVTVFVINKGQPSQYFGLKIADENTVLPYAPNNWKTKRGAENWAKKHGYTVVESSSAITCSEDSDGYGADESDDAEYLKKLADGVVKAYEDYFTINNLVYEISDAAITFIDGDVVLYIQPLSEIKPDMDDLDSDIELLADEVISAAIPKF